jgi:hypothetical protein
MQTLLQRLSSLLIAPPVLEDLTFERLSERFSEDPRGVVEEFNRRLYRTVFEAGKHFANRHPTADESLQGRAEKLTIDLFEKFTPQLSKLPGERTLLNFALLVEQELDRAAFNSVRLVFYYRLPLYHVRDNNQRRVLEVCYDLMLASYSADGVTVEVAQRLHMSQQRAAKVIRKAQKALNRAIGRYSVRDLRALTDNTLPETP